MFAAGLSQVTHVFIFLAFLQKEVNVYLSSRCLLSTRQSLTLTTTPLALTLPLIFWLLSADSRDTSSASTANSDDVYANCQLFSQLFYLKLIDFITVSLFICLFCVSDILFFGLGIFNTPALAHLYFAG